MNPCQISVRNPARPVSFRLNPSAFCISGAPLHRPSRSKLQKWYGHSRNRAFPLAGRPYSVGLTSIPRCGQTRDSTRTTSSFPRTTTIGSPSSSTLKKSPGLGTCETWPTDSHSRFRMSFTSKS